MVFSFFKKDPKDVKKGGSTRPPATGPRTGGSTDVATRPLAKPIGRPLDGPVNRSPSRPDGGVAPANRAGNPVPEREAARSHARQTAAKIDQIEAEMARDLMGQSTRGVATMPPRSMPLPPAEAPTVSPPTAVKPTAAADSLDINSEMLSGDIDAIEIGTSMGSSVIDEAAILYSNGQTDAAETMIRTGLQRDDLGSSTRTAWHMLFELINHRGDRAAFEQLAMDYALRFEHSPPAWIDFNETSSARPVGGAAAPQAASGAPRVRLPETVDAGIVGHLEQLRGLTAAHAAVQLDVSDVKRIDAAGASLLLRVLAAFKRSQRELTLVGAVGLADVLSRSVESGRRDPSDAPWLLLLEVLRMLDQSEAFEETAIQYCITFEVSPPAWESPPGNLKVAAAAGPAPASDTAAAGAPLELRGTVDGEGEPHFGRLVAAARGQKEVVVDCSQLRRLTFSAGSALLGVLRRVRQGGAAVELRNVGALVAALLHLLGVTGVASVQSRYR